VTQLIHNDKFKTFVHLHKFSVKLLHSSKKTLFYSYNLFPQLFLWFLCSLYHFHIYLIFFSSFSIFLQIWIHIHMTILALHYSSQAILPASQPSSNLFYLCLLYLFLSYLLVLLSNFVPLSVKLTCFSKQGNDELSSHRDYCYC